MTDNTTVTDTTEVNETPSFGIQDLVFTMQVFEACTSRGAFRADELSNVGAVYDRLKAFLTANGVFNNTETTEPAGDK